MRVCSDNALVDGSRDALLPQGEPRIRVQSLLCDHERVSRAGSARHHCFAPCTDINGPWARLIHLEGYCNGVLRNNDDAVHAEVTVSGERRIQSACAIAAEVAREPRFARFTALIFIFVGVRSVFRHLDATFPKYYVRSFGDNSQFELILMVNPTCILLLTPLMTCLVQRYQLDYSSVFLLGATFSGISPLVMALDTSQFMCLMFVLLLSLGEAIWSPKLYEYSVAIAPRGREATYSALSTTPAFLATG
eukprot:CAMPEP_0178415586 /NCGR_PEP_ID=MMETSP0689_2-20121128/23627_1 /TAXON_ID=160604 /ORGANISM="Amphidinium massartii, Strain CS-259" /LENGTH=248 /DNA_ID=CAMNT_0020036909 /DNA_START=79 /DNA_END=821 /DNA_ORIENTATION=+